MFSILSLLWFLRTTKVVLFYLYLWQLKEYHIKRFLDHFRTEKGKRLILNKIYGLKAIIFFVFLYLLQNTRQAWREELLTFFLWALAVLYLIGFLSIFKNIFEKKLRLPVITNKSAFLLTSALLVEVIFLGIAWQKVSLFIIAFWLLIFDILCPLIISLLVILAQPITVFWKRQLIKKAKIKRLQHPNLVVIGITGSFGKTTAKEFLAAILSQKFKVLKTEAHQNSQVGIPQCVLDNLKPEHKIFVVEMGAYGRGNIKTMADIVKPQVGILTGINQQHLVLFGSQENIIKGKYELIESLPKNGLAVFNGDNSFCLELYKMTGLKKLLYSTNKLSPDTLMRSDIWAEDIRIEKEFVEFSAVTPKGEKAEFKVNVLGGQNISNLLAAIITARELGMSLQEISKACQNIKQEQGPIKFISGKEGLNILDATYSSNPDGVIADLEYLKIWPRKKVIVMPCLIELGSASKEIHKKIGKKIGEVCDLAIITAKERFKEIKEGAKEAGMAEEEIIFDENAESIVTRINLFCSSDDTVLLEGRVPKDILSALKLK